MALGTFLTSWIFSTFYLFNELSCSRAVFCSDTSLCCSNYNEHNPQVSKERLTSYSKFLPQKAFPVNLPSRTLPHSQPLSHSFLSSSSSSINSSLTRITILAQQSRRLLTVLAVLPSWIAAVFPFRTVSAAAREEHVVKFAHCGGCFGVVRGLVGWPGEEWLFSWCACVDVGCGCDKGW